MTEEIQTGWISPVEVFEDDERRAVCGKGIDESPHVREKRRLVGDGRELTAGERGRGRGQ